VRNWFFCILRSIWPSTCRRLKVFAERDVYRCSSTKSRVREERFLGSYRNKERKRRLEKRCGARSARDANRYTYFSPRLSHSGIRGIMRLYCDSYSKINCKCKPRNGGRVQYSLVKNISIFSFRHRKGYSEKP